MNATITIITDFKAFANGLVPALLVILFLAPLLFLHGCSASYYSSDADRDVDAILGRSMSQFNADRRKSVIYPEQTGGSGADRTESVTTGILDEQSDRTDDEPPEDVPPREEAQIDQAARSGAGETRLLDLQNTLEIALQTNRSQISRKESLYLAVLSLVETRHSFTPQLSAVINYLFSDGTGRAWSQSAGMGLSVSQILPLGGSLSVNANTGYDSSGTTGLDNPRTFSSSLGVSLSQPLLRGAGHRYAFESLIQAERDLIYAIRDYEIFRQDFSISVAREYYDLVRQKKTIDNIQRNRDTVDYSYRKAKAFLNVGKATEIEVLNARQDALDAENNLIMAEQDYELALDQFKIFLGLPTTARIDVLPTEPEFIPVDYDPESAVEVALANRLDFITQKDLIEDSERGVLIAKNNLLPDLGLSLGYNLSSDPNASFGNQKFDNRSYSAGLSLEIPIDQMNERNSWRRAEIGHEARLRAFDEFKDGLVVSVVSSLRGLKRQRRTLDIQRQQIEDSARTVRIAELRFERGEIGNRDLLENQQNLLEARNRLIDEKVSYEITRLELLQDLGILFIDERGMWVE